jgi:hypothetical protein
MTRCAIVLIFCLLATGCKKAENHGSPAPSATSESPAPSARPGFTTVLDALGALDLRVEARRGALKSFEPLIEKQRPALEAHFGEPSPLPLSFQAVSGGADGRAAVLLQATRGEARPLVWLVDGSGKVLWTKEHPTGGVKPGVSEISLAAGPDGHICLAWCNAATDSIALRRWAEDGSAFADYEVLHVDACSALSVLYWPRRGWIVAVAWPGGASFQLISENGALTWGRDGMSYPWTFRSPAAVSLALDAIDSVMMFRLGQSGGPTSAEYIFATRFSVDGRPLWPGPMSLKRLAAPVGDPSLRLPLSPGPDGTVRVELSRAQSGGDSDVVIDVASDGTVIRH